MSSISLLNDYSSAGLSGGAKASGQATSSGQTASLSSVNLSKLSAGSTLSGEVIARDGSTVTLKLSDNQSVSAKLEGNADISIGQRLSFEVAKSGNQTMLRPLYANMSANSTVASALNAASININNTTLAFTSQMMKEGMPINKNALLDMYKNVLSFPKADPTSIVQMNKLGIELSDSNISQFENYKNFQHQIINDAAGISSGLYDLLVDSVNHEGASITGVDITQEILGLVDTDSLSMLEATEDMSGTLSEGIINTLTSEDGMVQGASNQSVENILTNTGMEGIAGEETTTEAIYNDNLSLTRSEQNQLINDLNEILELTDSEKLASPLNASEVMKEIKNLCSEYLNIGSDDASDNNISEDLQGKIEAETGKSIITSENSQNNNQNKIQNKIQNENNQVLNNTAGHMARLKNLGQKIFNSPDTSGRENVIAGEKAEVVEKSLSEQVKDKLSSLIRSEGFNKLFSDSVKAQFSMKAEDISKEGKIEEMYERILKTSSKVSELMSQIGQEESSCAKSAANIADNVNFINELNHYVNYVQLPLKMAGENAHGDLYVYTRHKNPKDSNGNFTAMLHLDMEHLGPMDVYVTMREYTKVNTHFYLQTDELLDFVESHIDELTKRLTQKGYNSSINISKKDPKEKITPITEEFLKDDNGNAATAGSFSKVCFDVRA